ncbi:iron chelate uptake ABC transporter family permease subunit [Escherichia coli]
MGEPHILGLNARAYCCRCRQCAWTGLSADAHCWRVCGGRVLVPVDIAAFSSAGRSGLTPMKVTLCGVALSAFVSSITAAILILDRQTLLAMRTWLRWFSGQDWVTLGTSVWFSLGGFVAPLPAPSLNMLALGDRMAQGLGVSVLRTRTFTLLLRSRCSVAQPYRLLAPLVLSAC